ncbi:polysaccharide biosynthesis/export family protein [Planktomarina sp.]|nr:polysaccharide biosynthesis/export family protein [Planktomarina sp.]
MIFVKLKSVLALIIGLGMATVVLAQDSNMQLQLPRNPQPLNQFQIGTGNGVPSGIPSANSPTIQDTRNLRLQSNVDAKFRAAETTSSVLENYYKILTRNDLSVFGLKEFSQGQDDSLLFFNTFGSEYRLAPGDVLRIILRGFVENNESYKVTRDGKIVLSNLPPIDVAGIRVGDVERKILELLQLGDASASAYVSLDIGRLVTVQISGGVELPRTVAIPAYTPLSRVLGYVGGLSDAGSLRNISLILNGGEVNKVDFYDFLQNPLGGFDPLITDNARIFVGDIHSTVAVSGFVARSGIYELPPGQIKISVKDLMGLAATNLLPPGALIEALYFDENGMVRSRKITIDGEINAGDALNIRFVNTRNTDIISVRGAVVEEYDLNFTEAYSLEKILKGGTVLSPQAELSLAIVHGPTIEPYIIDIKQILNEKKLNLQSLRSEIEPNSTIYVLSKSEYTNLIASNGQQLKKNHKKISTYRHKTSRKFWSTTRF